MSEDSGQAPAEQPTAHDAALSIVSGWLPKEAPEKAEAPEKPEAETPNEPSQEPTQAEIRRHKLKVKAEGGADEEVEVDDNELKSGYMRQRDYQRKTAEVARQRDQVHETVRSQVTPKLTEYQQRMQSLEQTILAVAQQELKGVDLNKLSVDNPAEWARLTQRQNELNQAHQSVKAEQERVSREQQQVQQQALQRHLERAEEQLQAEIPNWGPEVKTEIAKAGLKLGFSKEELSQIADPRAVKVLHFAAKYLQAQEAKPLVDKKVADVPKVLKPGSPEKSDQKADKWKEAAGRLKKSQGRDPEALLDAARLLV